VKKGHRKNPHAVALGRLGGLVRSEAKKRANMENGRKAAWSKAARRLLLPDATLEDKDPGAARRGERGDILDPRASENALSVLATSASGTPGQE